MPLLGPTDRLPQRPSRVLVTGSSGSGKTTAAVLLAGVLGIEHVEIDSLFHGPGWTERDSFLDDVRELVARQTWVTEYQYASARALLDAHAHDLHGPRAHRAVGLERSLARGSSRRRSAGAASRAARRETAVAS